MPNEFVARNGVIAQNNSTVTGSLTVTQGITGSLFGTASWAQNFTTSSVTSASYAFTASSAVSAAFAVSAAYAPGGASLSGGATNYAAVWASATTLTTGSIFVTQSNVGIGFLTPVSKLHVSGTTGGVFEVDGVNAINSLYVSSSGNVGIGTISTAFKLQVSGSSNVMNVRGSGSAATSSIFTVDGAAGRLFSVNDSLSGSLFSVNTIAGLPVMEAFSDNTVRIGQYGQKVLFVSQSKVGIGTEIPTANLHVSGTSGGVFEVDGRLAINALYVSSSGQIGMGTATPTALLHLTGSTGTLLEIDGVNSYQVLYASASGLIGIGTPIPTSYLHVSGTTGGVFEVDVANAVTAFYVSSSGNIGIRNTVPTFSLDISGDLRVTGSITGSRINPRSIFTGSVSVLIPNVSLSDMYIVNQLTGSLVFGNPIGSPIDGQKLMFRIRDNGVTRTLTWSGSQYRASTDLPLPTATTAGKTLYAGLIYNVSESKWDLLAKLDNF